MKHVNIGVLIPNSSIFPIGKSFERGLKEGLKPLEELDITFELNNEFAGQSGARQVGDIFDRFFSYHEADIVTGIISSRTAEDIASRFKDKRRALLINDVGGHIPNINKLNEYVFINSPCLWQHAWTLGHYGVSNLGKRGMYVSAVYDAGYSFSQMFGMGMAAASQDHDWAFAVAPMPAAGKLSDMSAIVPHIESHKPDFIFATFCGTEIPLFMNEFIARGLHKDIRVLGLPYLTSPFSGINDDMKIISTLCYANRQEITPDRVFHELGLKSGQLIATAAARSSTAEELQYELSQLNKCTTVTADGELVNAGLATEVTLTNNAIINNGRDLDVTVKSSYDTFHPDTASMRAMFEQINFGWLNPYLCV